MLSRVALERLFEDFPVDEFTVIEKGPGDPIIAAVEATKSPLRLTKPSDSDQHYPSWDEHEPR